MMSAGTLLNRKKLKIRLLCGVGANIKILDTEVLTSSRTLKSKIKLFPEPPTP